MVLVSGHLVSLLLQMAGGLRALEMRDQGLAQMNPDGTPLTMLSGGDYLHRLGTPQSPTSSAATDSNPKGLAMVLWSPTRPWVSKAAEGLHSRPVFKAVRGDIPAFSSVGILGDFASSWGELAVEALELVGNSSSLGGYGPFAAWLGCLVPWSLDQN